MRLLVTTLLTLALVPGLALTGCGSDKKKRPSGFPASVVHDLKAKGLEHSKFEKTEAEPYGAKECAQGQVEGLAVLLCRYDDAAGAKAAEAKLIRYVQDAVTGLVRTRGKVAMVVADPDKMDLRGKQIAKLVKAFGK